MYMPDVPVSRAPACASPEEPESEEEEEEERGMSCPPIVIASIVTYQSSFTGLER
jgi:hypothetical protein